jgi:hypothetical protein
MPESIADNIEREVADPFEGLEPLAENRAGAVAIVTGLQAFATLSYILAKRLADLQETIDFYDLNWSEPPRQKEAAALHATIGASD